MTSSESNCHASAFGDLTTWDQDSCQLAAPKCSTALLPCPWHWERGGVAGKGNGNMGLWWELCKEGVGRVGLLCAPAPWASSGSFHKGGGDDGLCMVAFYFHWVCFSLLVKRVACRREFNSWRRLSICTASYLKFFLPPIAFSTLWFFFAYRNQK